MRSFGGIYNGKTVLVTGHTGFKGSWLVYWLHQLGANVVGYSLEAPTQPNHFELLGLDVVSVTGDIRDFTKLDEAFCGFINQKLSFILPLQALVRYSYENPIETYEAKYYDA